MTGRNDPCPCGSGKKFKKCCGSDTATTALHARPAHRSSAEQAYREAVLLRQAGNLQRAEAAFRNIVLIEPGHADAWHLLGVVASQLGKQDVALDALERAVRLRPEAAEFYNSLGKAWGEKKLFNQAEAAYRRALDLQPDFYEAYLNLGDALEKQGQPDEALAAYRGAAAIKPDDYPAYWVLANALYVQGKIHDAADAYRRVIEVAPSFYAAYFNLANVYQALQRFDEAVEHYRLALRVKPDYYEAWNNLGNALRALNRTEEAISVFRKALELRPAAAITRYGLGNTLRDKGEIGPALEEYRRVWETQPNLFDVYPAFARCKKFGMDDLPDIRRLELLLERTGAAGAIPLGYALGKIFDDLGDYQKAFGYYQLANRLASQRYPFDRAAFAQEIEESIATFTKDFFAARADYGSASELPVLIVGMPRSGTTLVEQIIASHPQAVGAGELIFWGKKSLEGLPPGKVAQLSLPEVGLLAAEYLSLLNTFSTTAVRVSDKMPYNLLYLGLIHLAFPKARIIYCKRHPVDVCLSIYFQNFSYPTPFVHELDNLAFYYRQHEKLMAHWRSVLPPNLLLEVSYEALLADQEGISRQMLAFCGLEWDEACLAFHQTKRSVQTASTTQVRQPLYKTSLARWKNYLPYLGPLESLQPD